MEEANRLPPVLSSGDDSVDQITGSVAAGEKFPEDFLKLLLLLNSSPLEGEAGCVFWSQQDDRLSTDPPSENVNAILDFSPKVKDKIKDALGTIILHPRFGPSLVQFWAATEIGGRILLTTQNQPFALGRMGSSTGGLCKYRMKSMEYKFYGDIESGEEELGLPGRVFLYKFPESAPNVQYYHLKEYPRHDASLCQVRASWALPVFEHSSQVCVGVLELVSAVVDATSDWHNESFRNNLYDVLQKLDLRSIDVYGHHEMKYKDKDKTLMTKFQEELSKVLESVCERLELPLALAWVQCNACNKLLLDRWPPEPPEPPEGGDCLRAFKGNKDHLVDTLIASEIIASTGYHLRKGKAYSEMVYCSNITQLSIAEYPLVLFARQCGFRGWFRICLHSSYTGADVHILEFFLPTSSEDNENIQTTLSPILQTIKANSKTFKLASGEELGEKFCVQIFDFQNGQRLQYPLTIQALQSGDDGMDVINAEQDNTAQDDGMDVINAEQDNTVATISKGGTTKTQEREHKKTGVGFDISLEDVQRFSALSHKDAAMRLKVSSSTLKRVCRDHGICRWPPRIIDDETFSERSIITQDRKKGKTGVKIEIPLEVVLQHSNLRRDDAARELKVSSSTLKRVCRLYGIHRWPPRNIDDVGAPQPSHDVPPRNFDKVGAPQPLVELQEGILELGSDRPLASDSRDYRIPFGPPPNINKVGALGPSHVEHQDGSSQLTSDMPSNQAPLREEGILQLTLDRPSNQVLDDVTHVKPRDTAVQDTKTVTIRAKYVNVTLKFQLPLRSRLEELHQQQAKRLNLKPEAYDIFYEDDDGEMVLMVCDDDLTECINTNRSRSSSKNSIVVLIEPRKLM